MFISQLARGGGLTSSMSCLGYVCHVLMGQKTVTLRGTHSFIPTAEESETTLVKQQIKL